MRRVAPATTQRVVVGAMWALALTTIGVLLFIILFIQRRPTGLFALKGRAAEE